MCRMMLLAGLLLAMSSPPAAAQRDGHVSRGQGADRNDHRRYDRARYERERRPSTSVRGSGYSLGGSWYLNGSTHASRRTDDRPWLSPYGTGYGRWAGPAIRYPPTPTLPYRSYGSYGSGYQSGRNDRPWDDGATSSLGRLSVGAVVWHLPAGAVSWRSGGATYYTLDGVYYQRGYVGGSLAFIVVAPPVGGVIYDLPHGSTLRQFGNVQYYHHGETYYRRVYSGGRVAFQVSVRP